MSVLEGKPEEALPRVQAVRHGVVSLDLSSHEYL